MPYSSVEFEVSEDPKGRLRVSGGDVVSALVNALAQGEIDVACRLYEESGRAVAERLLAAVQAEAKLREPAARMFAQARDFARAARVRESAKHWPDAALLYAEATDFESAARCYKKAGDLFHAAQCFDAIGDTDEAVALYDKQGEAEVAADCLLRNGRPVEAAARFRKAGKSGAEADSLRLVKKGSKQRMPAVKRLGEILIERNRLAEATELIVETLQEEAAARDDLELHETLAHLFDRQQFPEHAERLRTRIARLQRRKATAAGAPETANPPVTASAEHRRLDAAAELAQSPDDGYASLKRVPLFAKLSLDDLKDLHRLTAEKAFQPGKAIVEINVDPPGLIVLLEGTAEVHAVGDRGQLRHLNSVGPGAYLGEISLLSGSLTSARVVASTYVRALVISPDKFSGFLQTRPSAALRIYRAFAKGLGDRVRALSTA